MPDEVLRYRAELDMSGLQAQLAYARQDIGFAIQQAVGIPGTAGGAFGGAFNQVSTDLSNVAASVGGRAPAQFGLQEHAFQAAQQTGLLQSAAIGLGIAAPPMNVFAGDFEEASQRALSQRLALGTARAASFMGTMGVGAAVGTAFGGPVGFVGGAAIGLGLDMVGGNFVERARGTMEMSNFLRARMPSLGDRDRQEAALGISDLAAETPGINFDEARAIVRSGVEQGRIRAQDAREFARESEEFMEDILTTMRALNTTGEEAARVLGELKRMGFTADAGVTGMTAEDALMRARAVAQMTGRDVGGVMSGAAGAQEGFRSIGVAGGLGFGMTNQAVIDQFLLRGGEDARRLEVLAGGREGLVERLGSIQQGVLGHPAALPFILGAVDPETEEFDRERFLDLVQGGTIREAMLARDQLFRPREDEDRDEWRRRVVRLLRRTDTEFRGGAAQALMGDGGPGIGALGAGMLRQAPGQEITQEDVGQLLQQIGFDSIAVEMFTQMGGKWANMVENVREEVLRKQAEQAERAEADRVDREGRLSAKIEKAWDTLLAGIDRKLGGLLSDFSGTVDLIDKELGENSLGNMNVARQRLRLPDQAATNIPLDDYMRRLTDAFLHGQPEDIPFDITKGTTHFAPEAEGLFLRQAAQESRRELDLVNAAMAGGRAPDLALLNQALQETNRNIEKTGAALDALNQRIK